MIKLSYSKGKKQQQRKQKQKKPQFLQPLNKHVFLTDKMSYML